MSKNNCEISNDNVDNQNLIDMNNSNNQISMNETEQNENNLYSQNYQQTWHNMQQNVNLIEKNLNNMNNILSLINLPIVIPYHKQHPLISCKTPGRVKPNNYWMCDNCDNKYSYNVPSFYCTACDYDICQKCFLSLNAYQIVVYNYSKSNIYATQDFSNNQYYKPNIHNHPIVEIIIEPTYSPINLKCNICLKDFKNQESLYYCGLCNFCLCLDCFISKNNNNDPFIFGPSFTGLTGEQIEP